jgi:uncharacterized protein
MLFKYSEFVRAGDAASAFAREAFSTLVANITQPDFPCYFAKNVVTKDSLYVAFAEGTSSRAALFAQIAEDFKAYAEIEKQPDPYRVLVLSVDWPSDTWASDDAFLWDLLAYLRTQDPEPWPADVPEDPHVLGWSFCFMGMPWFFNLNSPRNSHRASRNATGALSFVVQRTDGFDDLAPLESHDKLRWDLRARVAPYDGQASSPALACGPDNPDMYEWIQFHTPNLNTEKPASKCPYHAAMQAQQLEAAR